MRKGLIPVLAVSAIVLVLALLDLRTVRLTSTFLQVTNPYRVAGVSLTPKARIVTSADRRDAGRIWIVTPGPKATNVVAVQRRDDATRYKPRLRATVPGVPEGGTFDIARTAEGDPALYSIRQKGDIASVRIFGPLDGDPALIGKGRASLPPAPPKGGRREFRIATWSGDEPDLFVIDRGRDPRWRIHVYSGESNFTKLVANDETPYVDSGRLKGKSWDLDLGPVLGKKPDLVLITKSRNSGSHLTELHVLTGRSAFRHFIIEIPTAVPGKPKPGHSLVYLPFDPGADTAELLRHGKNLSVREIPTRR